VKRQQREQLSAVLQLVRSLSKARLLCTGRQQLRGRIRIQVFDARPQALCKKRHAP
jgi:hypothetical protein